MGSTRTVQPSVFQAPEVVHPVAEELERAGRQAAGGRVGHTSAHRLHGDRHEYPGTVGQPPVVRRVRVLTRLLRQAGRHLPGVSFCDHCRAAKRREQEIRSGRGARRRAATYRRLLRLVAQTTGYAAAARTRVCCVTEPWAESRCAEVGACMELVARVVDQTKRRVFDGETVPVAQKVVSLFEPHTDVSSRVGARSSTGTRSCSSATLPDHQVPEKGHRYRHGSVTEGTVPVPGIVRPCR